MALNITCVAVRCGIAVSVPDNVQGVKFNSLTIVDCPVGIEYREVTNANTPRQPIAVSFLAKFHLPEDFPPELVVDAIWVLHMSRNQSEEQRISMLHKRPIAEHISSDQDLHMVAKSLLAWMRSYEA